MSFRRVLLCTDGSRASLAAARRAVEIAQLADATVLALYVLADREDTRPIDVIATGQPPASERLERSGRSTLRFLEGLAEEAGITLETRLLEGTAAATILETAAAWDPDVIVVGRSGRHGPGSAFLGSVTEHVLEFADVPVLVVPA